jgi:hypothetical protein
MRLVLVIVFSLISFVALAQPGDPGGGGNPTVPISGIEILIAAGAALGLRSFFSKNKSKE